ncbi:hypothetical protein [Clostridium sp. AM34-9AC]|uniref:hypothetical protein n=1 Tax=Clostridium sp. AM34-9AC TaxID=2293030 RepID=UPI0026998CDE
MKELSIFIDESGDFGEYDYHSPWYIVTRLKINVEKRVISLNLQIDPKICSMYEYFEIFLGRMMMCKRAAEVLEASFKLTVNGSKVL